jgi:hypothetical protein
MTEPTEAIYSANVERVEMAYLKAKAAGVGRPVVLVLDLDDDFGEGLAASLEARGAALLRAPGLVVFALDGGGTFGAALADAYGVEDLDLLWQLAPDDSSFPTLVFAGGGIANHYRCIPE